MPLALKRGLWSTALILAVTTIMMSIFASNAGRSHPAKAKTCRVDANEAPIALGKGQVRAYTRGLTRQERVKW
jgi:hypothetical protein